MYSPYRPAPFNETLYYLAVLRRALHTIERHTSGEDVSGILFAGHLADALHNVPGIIWHWNEKGWWKPSEIGAWVVNGFPASLSGHNAPQAWIDEATQIPSFEYSGIELNMNGPGDTEFAPPDRYEFYLGVIANFLLRARFLRNWQRLPEAAYSLHDDSATDPAKAREEAREVGCIASLLVDVPAFLVLWAKFDELAFLERAQTQLAAIPGEFDRWMQSHEQSVQWRKSKEQAAAD